MKLEELKHGKLVRFIDASGLEPDKEYAIHSVDTTAWSVRLEGVMGSYSIDHIVGFDSTPSIPSDQTGQLKTGVAYPSDAVRELPKPETPKDETLSEQKVTQETKLPSIFDAIQGLEIVDLLDAMEGHLRALAAHPDPLVKYHARNALLIQWTIEATSGEDQIDEEDVPPKNDETP